MTSPQLQPASDRRALRDLMPGISVEIWVSAIFWAAYFCRNQLGFDPLLIFHKGGPAPAVYYFWCAIVCTTVAVGAIVFKIRRAKILQRRGVDTIGTIIGTTRRPRNLGWEVRVTYRVEGRDIVVLRNCDTKSRPTNGSTVPVTYDPQRPDRSWVEFRVHR